jgi:hypothetical protein
MGKSNTPKTTHPKRRKSVLKNMKRLTQNNEVIKKLKDQLNGK